MNDSKVRIFEIVNYEEITNQPGVLTHVYNPSYLGSRGRKITD
jgi:hypothetical protein